VVEVPTAVGLAFEQQKAHPCSKIHFIMQVGGRERLRKFFFWSRDICGGTHVVARPKWRRVLTIANPEHYDSLEDE
jgi:hypothetical protein